MKNVFHQGTEAGDQVPQPIRDGAGATDPGPRNVLLDRQNPDILTPPSTDAGTLPNLKFSFALAHNRLQEGGWARQVTVRELHWHKEAEWAYMLNCRARISAIDQAGRNFLDDVGVGDIWNFPAGIPHSIQGLEAGCEFLLVFDDGNFSDDSTFLITDWFAHTPRAALAKNFGVPESDFAGIPTHERYIFPVKVPGPLASDQVSDPYGRLPQTFSFRLFA